MKLKAKTKFNFYRNTCNLYLRKSFSNIFLTMTDKKGNVVKYIGAIDNNYKDASAVTTKYVEEAVDALIEGKEIKETETKAIGCSIKV